MGRSIAGLITIAPDLAQKSLSLPVYLLSVSVSVSHSLYLSSLLSLSFSLSLPHQPTLALNYLPCSLVELEAPPFGHCFAWPPTFFPLSCHAGERARAVASVDRRLSKLPPGRAVPRAAAERSASRVKIPPQGLIGPLRTQPARLLPTRTTVNTRTDARRSVS